VRVKPERLRQLVARVLKGEKAGGHVALLICDDRRMRNLNRRFLGKDRPTDVIAFGHAGPASEGGRRHLGDIAVSAETARRLAGQLKIAVTEELERYVVHGVLHLLGWRDGRALQRKRMRARQEGYLKRSGE